MSRTPPADHDTQDDRQRAEPATLTVLTRVRELIVTGAIPSGARLAAEAIARDLNVSRTPVRSALAVLAAEGLVSYHVNRGYTVRDIRLRDILDAIEARAVLESRACGLSVDYGWAGEELDQLRATVADGAAILARGEWSEEIESDWYRLNRAFHSLVVRVSRNGAIRTAIRMTVIYPVFGDVARLSPAVAMHVPGRHRVVPATPPAHIVDSQSDHERILAAIEGEDAPLSEQLMLMHVIKSKDRLAAVATRR